jgi:serine/threonine protein kinase
LAGFNVGTPLYMAPETLFKNQYTHKTDLWAIGCVYYEMLFGSPPFHSMEHQILIEKVKKYLQD